jgi:molecular chaperone GrpE (heat shock protein)
MLQKCTILGLVLLLAGGAAFGWLYRETRDEQRQAQVLAPANALESQEYIEKYGRWYQLGPEQQNQLVIEINEERKSKTTQQLGLEQQARLRADLDKLAAGQMNPGAIADFLYGRAWEDQVEQYKRHNEQMETAQTLSIVCLSIGSVLFGGCAILWLLRLLVRIVRALRHRSSEPEIQTQAKTAELTDIELHDVKPQTDPEASAPEEPPKQRRRLLASSEAENCGPGSKSRATALRTSAFGSGDNAYSNPPSEIRNPPSLPAGGEEAGVALLLADEPSHESGWLPQAQWSLHSASEAPSENEPREQLAARRSASRQPDEEKVSPLKEQADELQKQIAEFKQMAQNVQQVTREQSEPLSNTLKELTQQVSAIREYAASQQDRVEKLQDGYDWGIIRTFCLRVIRCLDNLEGRLAELPKGDDAVQPLEEIKDELLFALESSGVEQFRPEINSEFHGQEKLAEALKEKQPAKKPDQAGKIAKVIRPGYRYVIDDDNYRIVRTAQVKLYG